MKEFENKTALIFGGNSGIGYATTLVEKRYGLLADQSNLKTLSCFIRIAALVILVTLGG